MGYHRNIRRKNIANNNERRPARFVPLLSAHFCIVEAMQVEDLKRWLSQCYMKYVSFVLLSQT